NRILDKIPGVKQVERAMHGKDNFHSGRASDHIDKAVRQFEKLEKTLDHKQFDKAMKSMGKLNGEMAKMDPHERQKFENVMHGRSATEKDHDSQIREAGKGQGHGKPGQQDMSHEITKSGRDVHGKSHEIGHETSG